MTDGDVGHAVCGFSDLASGLGGLAWSIAGGGGLLLSDGDVKAAEPAISKSGSGMKLELSTGDATVEAELAELTPAPELAGDGVGLGASMRTTTCTATVRSKGWGRTLQCPGHITTWSEDPLAGAGTFRHLTIEGSGGSLLLLVSRGAPGAEGHGDEEAGAWLLDAEGGAVAFGEALLSTQYDEAGRQTRVGAELWPEGEEQTARAAATRPAGSRLGGVEVDGVSAALLRFHTEGTEGLGSYLLWRA
jgi:hypothetical protein